MAESSMPKRSEDDCDMVTSLQEPFLSKAELTLHEAARSDKRAEVERLVKTVKVDCRNSLDRTPLHMAASKGHKVVVTMLVENKASVELTDKYGMSPLMWATYFGHMEVAQYLIDKSANIKRRNKLGMHCLHIAAEQNHCELVKLFLSKTKRTILDDTEKNGQSAIMIAAAKGNHEVVSCLLGFDANLTIHDVKRRNVVHLAAGSGSAESVTALLTSKQKTRELVDDKDEADRTPLHYAIEKGHVKVIEVLLSRGACPNEATDKDISPFHLAALHGHIEILKMLEVAGTEIEAVNNIGYTALHYAVLNDNATEIYTLIHMGCDVEAKNNRQQTPMHMAAEQNKIKAAEALLLSGAPLNSRDKTGKTPLILATRGSCVCIVDMIIKAERHRDRIDRVLNNEPAPWSAAAQSDQLDAAAAFTPAGYENRTSVNEPESVEDELTEEHIRTTGEAPEFRLREFNQPYAEEFKQFLWKLAFKHLRHGEWKKLAAFWRFRVDHIQAIEQQQSDESSYKQHGYRILCIWFHGIGRDTPIRELYEALVNIGRRPLAEKVRQKLDRSVEYFSAGRLRHEDGKRCAVQ